MSTKYNSERGGKKARGYSSGATGMHKHGKSGVAHNHRLTIEANREEAKRLDAEAELKKKQKGKMYSSIKELFKNYG